MKNAMLGAAGLATAGLLAVSTASAAPLGGVAGGGAVADTSLVEKVHDFHRACVLGPRGWHYHSRLYGRVVCRPPIPGRYWIWRSEGGRTGWWHPRERRWY